MITVKTEKEIDAMREPCAIVRDTLTYIGTIQVCAVLPHDQIQPAFISSGNALANAAIFRFLYFHVC